MTAPYFESALFLSENRNCGAGGRRGIADIRNYLNIKEKLNHFYY
jgi:hypothetical protein